MLAAFLTGWTSFVAGFSGAIAASAVALADYAGRFVPGADATPLLTVPLPGLNTHTASTLSKLRNLVSTVAKSAVPMAGHCSSTMVPPAFLKPSAKAPPICLPAT